MSEDVHALVGAYALDAVDEEERAAFERHLAACDDCSQELPTMLATAARLGAVEVAKPPAHLKSSVLTQVQRTRQVPPVVATLAEHRRRRTRWASLVSAAAALLLVVGGGLVAWEVQRVDAERERADLIAAVVADPSRVQKRVAVTGGGSAEVITARGAALVALDLPRLPDDRTYQLWKVLPGDRTVSAGVLGVKPGRAVLVEDVGDVTAFAVTVEVAGGVEQSQNNALVVVPV